MTRLLLALTCAVALSGCYRHTYVLEDTPVSEPSLEAPFRVHIVFGVISLENDVKLQHLCPSGVATIETQQSFLNGVIAFLTSGWVTPRDLRIFCSPDLANKSG